MPVFLLKRNLLYDKINRGDVSMTTIILLRHGESVANSRGIIAAQLDMPLSDVGRQQAKLAAKYIAENYKIDKIYSSDLSRAYDTASAVAAKLNMKIIKTKALREIYAGIWEGMKYTDIAVGYAEDYKIWLEDIGKSRPTGGESAEELGIRIMSELNRIADENEGKTVLAATHACAIRAVCTVIELGSIERMQEFNFVSNASVNILTREDGKWKVCAISIDEYLADLRTDFPAQA